MTIPGTTSRSKNSRAQRSLGFEVENTIPDFGAEALVLRESGRKSNPSESSDGVDTAAQKEQQALFSGSTQAQNEVQALTPKAKNSLNEGVTNIVRTNANAQAQGLTSNDGLANQADANADAESQATPRSAFGDFIPANASGAKDAVDAQAHAVTYSTGKGGSAKVSASMSVQAGLNALKAQGKELSSTEALQKLSEQALEAYAYGEDESDINYDKLMKVPEFASASAEAHSRTASLKGNQALNSASLEQDKMVSLESLQERLAREYQEYEAAQHPGRAMLQAQQEALKSARTNGLATPKTIVSDKRGAIGSTKNRKNKTHRIDEQAAYAAAYAEHAALSQSGEAEDLRSRQERHQRELAYFGRSFDKRYGMLAANEPGQITYPGFKQSKASEGLYIAPQIGLVPQEYYESPSSVSFGPTKNRGLDTGGELPNNTMGVAGRRHEFLPEYAQKALERRLMQDQVANEQASTVVSVSNEQKQINASSRHANGQPVISASPLHTSVAAEQTKAKVNEINHDKVANAVLHEAAIARAAQAQAVHTQAAVASHSNYRKEHGVYGLATTYDTTHYNNQYYDGAARATGAPQGVLLNGAPRNSILVSRTSYGDFFGDGDPMPKRPDGLNARLPQVAPQQAPATKGQQHVAQGISYQASRKVQEEQVEAMLQAQADYDKRFNNAFDAEAAAAAQIAWTRTQNAEMARIAHNERAARARATRAYTSSAASLGSSYVQSAHAQYESHYADAKLNRFKKQIAYTAPISPQERALLKRAHNNNTGLYAANVSDSALEDYLAANEPQNESNAHTVVEHNKTQASMQPSANAIYNSIHHNGFKLSGTSSPYAAGAFGAMQGADTTAEVEAAQLESARALQEATLNRSYGKSGTKANTEESQAVADAIAASGNTVVSGEVKVFDEPQKSADKVRIVRSEQGAFVPSSESIYSQNLTNTFNKEGSNGYKMGTTLAANTAGTADAATVVGHDEAKHNSAAKVAETDRVLDEVNVVPPTTADAIEQMQAEQEQAVEVEENAQDHIKKEVLVGNDATVIETTSAKAKDEFEHAADSQAKANEAEAKVEREQEPSVAQESAQEADVAKVAEQSSDSLSSDSNVEAEDTLETSVEDAFADVASVEEPHAVEDDSTLDVGDEVVATTVAPMPSFTPSSEEVVEEPQQAQADTFDDLGLQDEALADQGVAEDSLLEDDLNDSLADAMVPEHNLLEGVMADTDLTSGDENLDKVSLGEQQTDAPIKDVIIDALAQGATKDDDINFGENKSHGNKSNNRRNVKSRHKRR